MTTSAQSHVAKSFRQHRVETDNFSISENEKSQIKDLIQENYAKPIENLDISITYLRDFHVFFSDPGWRDGGNLQVNCDCYVIKFETYSKEYKDTYYYFITTDGQRCFYKNTYSGKSYHGGSAKEIDNIPTFINKIFGLLSVKN